MAEQEMVHYRATSMLTSRTMWFNVITILVGLSQLTETLNVLGPGALKYIAFVNAAGNMILRTFSVRPVALIPPGTSVSVEVPKLPTANR